jgi:hypothetical protein
MSGDFLHELENEVEADLTMVEASHPAEAAVLPPSEWTEDPAEVEWEQTSLRSLLGAVQSLEDDSGS